MSFQAYVVQGPHVLEHFDAKTGELIMRRITQEVFRDMMDSQDLLYVAGGSPEADDSVKIYDLDSDSATVDQASGTIFFDGGDKGEYVLRRLTSADGAWASDLKVPVPADALEYLLDTRDASRPVVEELLTAFSPDGSTGPVTHVEYSVGVKSYIRKNSKWEPWPAETDSIEDMSVFEIRPDAAAKFLEVFDKGAMTVERINSYVQPEGEMG